MPDQSSAATEHAILAEITRPLEALPPDPLAVVDADFSTVLRGYDRGAVDEYVRQTRQVVADLQATRSPEAAVRRALERVGEQISGILQRAHETAEQITAQSRSEAEDRLEQARAEAAQIADAAERRVKDLDADTDRIWLERQRIVADAEDLAGQLLAVAKTAAERFPADAEAEAAGTLVFDAAAGDEQTGDEQADDEHTEGEQTGDDQADDEQAELEPYDDPADDVEAEAEAESEAAETDDRSEIERTLAFRPLEPGGPAAEEEAVTESDTVAAADAENTGAATPAEPGATDDDDTAVIPPASQAANRRLNQ
jgi:cell division septum initiation protein DivIVA